MIENYDSTADTLKHIKRVSQLLNEAAIEILKRANCHDDSKLQEPEKAYFDEFTPLLKDLVYGSEEARSISRKMLPGIKHHHENNSHHPEFYENKIDGMNLFDIVEMFFDWKASSERSKDGNIYESIKYNKNRFKMSDQLCSIFENTAKKLNWEK